MKKVVIATGGKQYLVSEGETINVELLKNVDKQTSFQPLMVIDGENVQIGTPLLDKVSIDAEIIAEDVKADKVLAIRYKAKKRVHKIHGHRQHHTTLKFGKVSSK